MPNKDIIDFILDLILKIKKVQNIFKNIFDVKD